jgi:Trk K+ transport system NAD-binding subunit
MAAARALRRKEIPIHMIERDGTLADRLRLLCEQVFVGDATDPEVLQEAGLQEAPSVLLTTKDDAMNIYLASLCRRRNPEIRIVSRITRERNIEAIHSAGADFVLGSASLGIEAVFSILKGQEVVILGEGVDMFSSPLPAALSGMTLAASNIGARTGLTVIAVQQQDEILTSPPASVVLQPGAELLMFGDAHQRKQFTELFG